MEIIKAVLFGIVEGITEWLPVSSTGHMILLDEFVKLKGSADFVNVFLVVIQLGAIFAVVLQFWNQLFPFQFKDKNRPVIEMEKMILWGKILLACIPAAVIGILFDDVFEAMFYHAVPVAIALIVFGIAFIVIERWNKGKRPRMKTVEDLTISAVLIIGVFQLIAAIFPGTSRSGATIVGALLIGVSRKAASEFTFFLAVPVMLGASLLKVLQYGFAFSGSELLVLAVGMITAFLVSIVVIRFLMDYIKKHDFQAFGWYRIVLGIIVLLCSMAGVIQV
ncbi:undecaprenyl-diphosphate phosphatase [Sellimonas catena]|uniref:Undecaprenyl-diphosphatase n=1 Tax=Sellimonas catena TaxID=2994035 RepID=A0A9W6C415_9FIRM|nr:MULTISPECIES: undecaprenyl-diphosphate phosphatase [Clostridia]OUN69260.1 undecaprenyl-diphosphatase [Drancourtella sp. An57]GLG03243.1 undecaprenyl-diphosphatase 1 [Sellimonas catena]